MNQLTRQDWINVVHLPIGIALILLGYYGSSRNLPLWSFKVMGLVAGIIMGYHAYRLVTKGLYANIIYLIHIFLVAPLLAVTAWYQNKVEKVVYDLFIIAGFAGVGFHTFKLIRYRI